jgi:hypothetical protein
MGLDTKTYWLADRQSQCDLDFDLTSDWVSWELLVAEAGDSSGTQRKGNVRRWKPLSSND